MDENGTTFLFDFSSLGGIGAAPADDRDGGSRSTFSSGSEVARLDAPANELSRLLVENDWEDALLALREDRASNDNDDDDDGDSHARNINIACVVETRDGRDEDRRGMLPLHYACREGAPPDLVRELLRANTEGALARAEESGRTALHFVAGGRDDGCGRKRMMRHEQREKNNGIESDISEDTSNRIAAARILLDASPQLIKATDRDGGMSPLHVACLAEAEPDLLAVLVDAGPSVACLTDDAGNLPLHWMFHPRVSADSVRRVLDAHPDGVQAVDSNGALPLHKACAVGAPADAIRLLLSRYPQGARTADDDGNLPLHLIVPKFPGGEAECRERERDVEARAESLRELLEIHPEGSRARNRHGETPFHRTLSEKAPLDLVRPMRDASPDCCNDMILSSSTGKEVAEVVRESCSLYSVTDTNGTEGSGETSTAGLTPLHLACRYDAPADVVRALLDANPSHAQCLALDGPGGAHLPLHAACRTGASIDTIDALIESYPEGASRPDGNDGRLPLHLECMTRCDPAVVRALLNAHRAGAEMVDARGRTALHYAAEWSGTADWKGVAAILAKAFPDAVEVRDEEGRLPRLDSRPEEGNDSEEKSDRETMVAIAGGRKKSVRFA